MIQKKKSRAVMIAALAVSVTVAAGLSGCSSAAPTSGLGSKASGTVQFWDRSAITPWSKQVVAAFNASHKDVQVKITSINDAQLSSKLATALRTNNVPDLVTTDDVDAISYISAGQFLDLTRAIDDAKLRDVLSKPQLALATVSGKNYGTPAVLDASVLLYSKKLFAQAGIAGPPANLTEALDDARKIHALSADDYGFYFPGACSGCLAFGVMPNLYADGADLVTGDDLHAQTATVEGNESLQKTLQFYQDLWTEGLTPKAAQSDTGSGWATNFQKGNVGMAAMGLFGYTTATPEEQKDIGIAPLPGASGGISTFIGGANFGIPKKAKNAAGAWEFIQYALGKKMQELTPSGGFAPVRTDLVNDAAFKAANPIVVPGLTASVTGRSLHTLYHNQLFSVPAGPWQKMFTKAVFGGDVKGAITEGQAGFEAVLKGNG